MKMKEKLARKYLLALSVEHRRLLTSGLRLDWKTFDQLNPDLQASALKIHDLEDAKAAIYACDASDDSPLNTLVAESYLAGFEKAKALILDHVQRSIDPRIAPDYLEVSSGKKPSEVLAIIGEQDC